jgi:peptidylprolyl isomerase/FKBP-type peptidyl-prolyl cis-trans isomerase FklB
MAATVLAGCGERAPAAGDEAAATNLREAEFFLASNAKVEGVRSLPSGVQYKVVQSGPPGGESPDRNDLVRVDYEGTLTDGTVFDSSFEKGQPAVFTVSDVVPGWTEALQHMKVGDEWVVYVPPAAGYGEQGRPGIPANAVMVFRLKLLDIARAPGGERGGAMAQG